MGRAAHNTLAIEALCQSLTLPSRISKRGARKPPRSYREYRGCCALGADRDAYSVLDRAIECRKQFKACPTH